MPYYCCTKCNEVGSYVVDETARDATLITSFLTEMVRRHRLDLDTGIRLSVLGMEWLKEQEKRRS